MNPSLPVLGLGAFLVVLGCQSKSVWRQKDSWCNPPPQPMLLEHRQELSEVVVIPEQTLPLALARLESASTAIITPEEACKLAPSQTRALFSGEMWYLVRALRLATHGHFDVHLGQHYLWVHYGALGRKPATMHRAAVLVPLREAPEMVYVSATMAD